jgi:hypothetical protein
VETILPQGRYYNCRILSMGLHTSLRRLGLVAWTTRAVPGQPSDWKAATCPKKRARQAATDCFEYVVTASIVATRVHDNRLNKGVKTAVGSKDGPDPVVAAPHARIEGLQPAAADVPVGDAAPLSKPGPGGMGRRDGEKADGGGCWLDAVLGRRQRNAVSRREPAGTGHGRSSHAARQSWSITRLSPTAHARAGQGIKGHEPHRAKYPIRDVHLAGRNPPVGLARVRDRCGLSCKMAVCFSSCVDGCRVADAEKANRVARRPIPQWWGMGFIVQVIAASYQRGRHRRYWGTTRAAPKNKERRSQAEANRGSQIHVGVNARVRRWQPESSGGTAGREANANSEVRVPVGRSKGTQNVGKSAQPRRGSMAPRRPQAEAHLGKPCHRARARETQAGEGAPG